MKPDTMYTAILRAAEAERQRRRGSLDVSELLLRKSIAYRIKHGIHLPFFALTTPQEQA